MMHINVSVHICNEVCYDAGRGVDTHVNMHVEQLHWKNDINIKSCSRSHQIMLKMQTIIIPPAFPVVLPLSGMSVTHTLHATMSDIGNSVFPMTALLY